MKKGQKKAVSASHQDLPEGVKIAGLRRRLAALLYDSLLVIAALLIASLAYIIPAQLISGGPTSGAENISTTAYDTPVYKTYLFMVGFFFLGWFWTHGGQTLGLRVWRLRIETLDGHAISWWQAALRYLAAIFPWVVAGYLYFLVNEAELLPSSVSPYVLLSGFFGFAWMLFNKQHMTLHDKFSDSRVVQLPPKKKDKA